MPTIPRILHNDNKVPLLALVVYVVALVVYVVALVIHVVAVR